MIKIKPPTHKLDFKLSHKQNNPPNGLLLKEARQEFKLTQAEVSKMLYASIRIIQDWENGRRNMPQAKWELFMLKAGPR